MLNDKRSVLNKTKKKTTAIDIWFVLLWVFGWNIYLIFFPEITKHIDTLWYNHWYGCIGLRNNARKLKKKNSLHPPENTFYIAFYPASMDAEYNNPFSSSTIPDDVIFLTLIVWRGFSSYNIIRTAGRHIIVYD